MKKCILFLFFGFYYTLFFADGAVKSYEIENNGNYLIEDLMPVIDTSITKINVYYFNNEHDSILSNVIMYDKLGRKSSVMTLDKIGKNIVQKVDSRYFNNTTVLLNTTINKFYDKKTWTDIYAYKYDSTGKIINQYYFDIDTSFLSTTQYIYTNNNITEVLINGTKAKDFYTNESRKYDKLNRLIKIEKYFSDKSLWYTLKFTYDKNTVSQYYISPYDAFSKHLQTVKEYSNGNLIRYKNNSEKQQETLKGTNGSVTFNFDNYEVNYFYEGNRLGYLNIKHSNNVLTKIKLYYVQKSR